MDGGFHAPPFRLTPSGRAATIPRFGGREAGARMEPLQFFEAVRHSFFRVEPLEDFLRFDVGLQRIEARILGLRDAELGAHGRFMTIHPPYTPRCTYANGMLPVKRDIASAI